MSRQRGAIVHGALLILGTAAVLSGCSEPSGGLNATRPGGPSPMQSADAEGVAAAAGAPSEIVPEWPPGYEGRKPWNRNPETPKDNVAYQKKGERINVIGMNGPLFVDQVNGKLVDWPKPKAALLLTGSMQGYIEPCGCSGLENMKGGLARRHTLIQELEADGWPVVLLDLGELAHRIGPQPTIKHRLTIDSLRKMGYRNIGLGLSDLRLSAGDLIAAIEEPTHYVSANVKLFGDDTFTVPFRVLEAGGMKIGVTTVTLPSKDQPLQNPDVTLADPAEALKKVVPQLVAQKCQYLVLLVAPAMRESLDQDETRKQAIELGRQFPQLNFVVIPTDADPPAQDLKPIDGKPRLVELSHKSMFAGVVALYDDAAQGVRYQRVPMDARFRDSPLMKELQAAYQEQLRAEGFDKLGVRPRPHPTAGKFVGSKACQECHGEEYAIWEKTPHAHALETLEHVKPPRLYDPECLSCHVTGWDAKEYVPFVSGFQSKEKTPLLAGNGCENCHGPGSEHVAAERADKDEKLMERLRKQMQLTLAEADDVRSARSCRRCHDVDNSPGYLQKGIEHYWPKVKH